MGKVTRTGDIYMKVFTSGIFILSSLFAARPFNVDDAGTVAPGGFELELGGDVWEDYAILGLGFKHGLTDRMDIGVGFGYTILPDDTTGLGGAEVDLKFALVPDLFATSFTGSLGTMPYALNAIITRNFGPAEVDINVGYEATGIEGSEGTITYALAIIYSTGPIELGAEASGDEEDIQSWLAGARYAITNNFVVDGGIIGGFQEDSALSATLGIHYEF
jgi:hypothetical protein